MKTTIYRPLWGWMTRKRMSSRGPALRGPCFKHPVLAITKLRAMRGLSTRPVPAFLVPAR